MTLHVIEGHSPVASLFKCDILYLWRIMWSLCICRASCYNSNDDDDDDNNSLCALLQARDVNYLNVVACNAVHGGDGQNEGHHTLAFIHIRLLSQRSAVFSWWSHDWSWS